MERWLPVVGFEGYYEVSDLGRVRRSAPPISHGGYTRVGRVLTPGLTPYPLVTLCRDGVRFSRCVHTLVLEAFIGPRPISTGSRVECNHRDGDKTNNRLDNLEWETRRGNALHAVRLGLQRIRWGEERPNARLTEAAVRYIRSATESRTALAKRFGVAYETVCDVLSYRTWVHVT